MKVAVGRPGTMSGLLLRIGQSLFAAASIAFMVSALGFSNYTAFCYLIASMGLQALWSFGLACLDFYAMWIKRDLHSAVLVSLFVVGDWVTATLSLAAACSSAGVVVLFARDVDFCRTYFQHACHKYEISIAFAFITWLLIAISSLVMLWLLASV
ncbi:putative casparian strip membrane protein [Dioscorea sansibarensis]